MGMANTFGPHSFDDGPELPSRACIYAITNRKLGRVFIGSTADARQRFTDHKRWFRDMFRGTAREFQNGRIKSSLYCADAASYPPGEFTFEIIDMSPGLEDRAARVVRENDLMLSYPALHSMASYNGQRAGWSRYLSLETAASMRRVSRVDEQCNSWEPADDIAQSSSSRLAVIVKVSALTPVTLPAGRAGLTTRPGRYPPGLWLRRKTIGMDLVAVITVLVPSVPLVTITSTRMRASSAFSVRVLINLSTGRASLDDQVLTLEPARSRSWLSVYHIR
jgi:hypothetical protein